MKIKNSLLALSLVAVTSLNFTGCTSQNNVNVNSPVASSETIATQMPQQDPNACYEQDALAPNWICDPSVEGGIGVVGTAPSTQLGAGFQQQEAMANARDTIAREMGTKVSNMFKSYASTTGVGEQSSVEKVATNVSKQIAKQDIVGSKQKGRWKAPDGTIYLWVVLDPNGVSAFSQQAKTVVKTSLRNEQALWQEFKASKAQDELDAEISKQMGN